MSRYRELFEQWNNVESNIDQLENELVESILESCNGDFEKLDEEFLEEGIFGKILGGIGGMAVGSIVAKVIIKSLGIAEGGMLWNLLNSKLFQMTVGAEVGNQLTKRGDK